jgi:hypothetical protein
MYMDDVVNSRILKNVGRIYVYVVYFKMMAIYMLFLEYFEKQGYM